MICEGLTRELEYIDTSLKANGPVEAIDRIASRLAYHRGDQEGTGLILDRALAIYAPIIKDFGHVAMSLTHSLLAACAGNQENTDRVLPVIFKTIRGNPSQLGCERLLKEIFKPSGDCLRDKVIELTLADVARCAPENAQDANMMLHCLAEAEALRLGFFNNLAGRNADGTAIAVSAPRAKLDSLSFGVAREGDIYFSIPCLNHHSFNGSAGDLLLELGHACASGSRPHARYTAFVASATALLSAPEDLPDFADAARARITRARERKAAVRALLATA